MLCRPALRLAMTSGVAYRLTGMAYASVNGLQLYYEAHGSGRPLVLLHGGLMTIDLNFGSLLEPLAAGRQVIAVEFQCHGHTADTGRLMTIEALAGDVVALLDQLRIAEADLFGFSLGGLVAYAVALSAPARVGKLIVASADAHRPPGRESATPGDDRLPTLADFQAMRDAYEAVAPDPARFGEPAAKTSALVHEFPGWTGELRSLQAPTLLIFGDRDFLTVGRRGGVARPPAGRAARRAPRDDARGRDTAARRSARVDHAVP
jgi:pimeloyl-ACP methyl ester carboxylesterase